MWRLVESETHDVLRSCIPTENLALDIKKRYEDGDVLLGIYTEGFYAVEEYEES